MAFEVVKVIYGLTQMSKAKKALKRLANWKPEFRSGESILQEATAKTPYGYTAQEDAAFKNNLARLNTQRYRLASQTNPNMASNINAGIQYGSIGALNEFAKNDAILKQQKIGQLASSIRSQDNMNVQNKINQKSQMEQAYGEAYKAGLSNVVGAFDSKMNDLKTVASFVIPFAGAGGATTSTPSTTTQMLGDMVGGKTLKNINQNAAGGMGAGAAGANVVGDIPYNTNWRPLATPSDYNPFKPYSMTTNDWITNPNQFRP
jgi:hypothetical protein